MSSDHLRIDASFFFFLLVNDLIIHLNLEDDFVSQQTILKLRERRMYAFIWLKSIRSQTILKRTEKDKIKNFKKFY